MKPRWKDAPDWASYMAMDDDGEWYWYEREPHMVHTCWTTVDGNGGRYESIPTVSDDPLWTDSVEKRP